MSLFLFELNIVGVSGMGLVPKLEKVGREMIGEVMPGLSVESPGNPFEAWITMLGGRVPPIVTWDRNEVPALVPPGLMGAEVFELGKSAGRPPAWTQFWWDVFPQDLMDAGVKLTDGWKRLAQTGLNPLGVMRLERKSLLSVLKELGLPSVPTTITIPSGCHLVVKGDENTDQEWVQKPSEDFGGHGVQLLNSGASLAGYVLQEEINNFEPFVEPAGGVVERRTDLRVYFTFSPRGCWVVGMLGRVAPVGGFMCNVSSGGSLTPGVFLVDDAAAVIAEWNSLIGSNQIVPKGQFWYRNQQIPLTTRPRFVPLSILPELQSWGKSLYRLLRLLNEVLPPRNDWEEVGAWDPDSQPLFLAADFGADFSRP